MTTASNNLPYNVLFNIFEKCDDTSRNRFLQVNQAWNGSGKCFELIAEALITPQPHTHLVKAGSYFIAAMGRMPKKFTKLFYLNIDKKKLIKAIDDSRTTIRNIFSVANHLLVEFPRGIKIFRSDEKGILKIKELIAKKHSNMRVEALNDSYIVLQSIAGNDSEIVVLDSKTGSQLNYFPSMGICNINIVDDILHIAQKNLTIRYSLSEQTLLDKTYDMKVLIGSLQELVEIQDLENQQTDNFPS